jgi:hypothetical protein
MIFTWSKNSIEIIKVKASQQYDTLYTYSCKYWCKGTKLKVRWRRWDSNPRTPKGRDFLINLESCAFDQATRLLLCKTNE